MVYFYTSNNVKILRDIINDYALLTEISACEYMKTFIEKCPETMEDAKISWIIETFLNFQKHELFNNELKLNISKELLQEDQDFFVILFHAMVFYIAPKDAAPFYKCLFHLSKPLLHIFTTYLGSDAVLSVISHTAQSYYDTNFITEKIIKPLILWQPYLRGMTEKYIQYVKKIEIQKIKQTTVPVSPKAHYRNIKTFHVHPMKQSVPNTPPNFIRKLRVSKMLTKTDIDKKLKEMHEVNKQKAIQLLKNAKSKSCFYSKPKNNSIADTKNIPEKITKATNFSTPTTLPVVKETTTTIKRIDRRIKISQKEEIQWLEDLISNCKNTTKVEELEDFDRQERERERLIDIERKHLLGQISFEEAVIAKKKLSEENKKKHDDFMKEKRLWEEEIEQWKKNEMEKNRKHVEKLSLVELDMLHAKSNNIAKKREMAETLRKESEELLAKSVKAKQDELENKIKIIRELKILAMISKKIKMPKIIDLTESSRLGLLCEMSILELQEKLNIIKIKLKEELDIKRTNIKENKETAKKDLEEKRKNIESYMSERAHLKKGNKNLNPSLHKSCNEIDELKKLLAEKRNLRLKLSVP